MSDGRVSPLTVLVAILKAKAAVSEAAKDLLPLLQELKEDDYQGAANVLMNYGTFKDLLADLSAQLEPKGVPAEMVPVVLQLTLPAVFKWLDPLLPEEALIPIVEIFARL